MEHTPVLLKEVIEGLNISPKGIYIDCTLGRGGHSLEILKRLKTGKLIAIDQDPTALNEAKVNLAEYVNQITYVQANFANLDSILAELEIDEVDGILMDLGVSSPQFDDPSRGFSYRHDSRLDMRMDPSNPISAYEIINTYSYEKLAYIFYTYGEDHFAKQIARKIEHVRQDHPIETSFQLVELLRSVYPSKVLKQKGHPAKQVFQALRIEVNQELNALSEGLTSALKHLKPEGRLVVISFHSLEDRLVKHLFKEKTSTSMPDKLPVIQLELSDYILVSKKAISPSQDELDSNPRAHSANLRIIQRR